MFNIKKRNHNTKQKENSKRDISSSQYVAQDAGPEPPPPQPIEDPNCWKD